MDRRENRGAKLRGARVARPGFPIVVAIADGWTRDTFLSALGAGQLPDVQRHFVEEGRLLGQVVSNLPSVSIASHASILTAEFQDRHRIPGHRWLERSKAQAHDYLRLSGPAEVNRHLSADVRTIFEAHPDTLGISIQGVVSRGADIRLRLPTMRSGPLLALTGACATRYPNSVIVTWLPRGDALSHIYGPDHPRVVADMRQTSRALGRLMRRLRDAGLSRSARILVVPDHGHRLVERAVSLEEVLAGAGLSSAVNPKKRLPGLDSVAFTSGDSAAYVYLQRPDVDPITLAHEMCRHPAVEIVCALRDGILHCIGQDGHATAQRRDSSAVEYTLQTGSDPLRLMSPGESRRSLDLSTPALDPREPYPDFLHQALRSHVDGRSGDLLVLAARGVHFGQGPRIGWRLGFHRGSHGGPFVEEILVAALFRGPMSVSVESSLPSATGAVRSADLLRQLGLLDELTTGDHVGSVTTRGHS